MGCTLPFIVGAFIGFIAGVFLIALLSAAGGSDGER